MQFQIVFPVRQLFLHRKLTEITLFFKLRKQSAKLVELSHILSSRHLNVTFQKLQKLFELAWLRGGFVVDLFHFGLQMTSDDADFC